MNKTSLTDEEFIKLNNYEIRIIDTYGINYIRSIIQSQMENFGNCKGLKSSWKDSYPDLFKVCDKLKWFDKLKWLDK